MIWKISWKNVWRNKSRSLIVVCAVTVGTIAGVFVAGLMKGWVDQRIRSAIYTEVSHIKIQNPEYLVNEETKYSIPDYTAISEFLNQSTDVKAWTKHVRVMSMTQTARGNAGIWLIGINPEEEKKVSNLYEYIVPDGGDYFESESRIPSIFISDKTAEQLRIKNFIVTQNTLDSLINQGVKKEAIKSLESIKDERFFTEKLFKSKLKTIFSKKELAKLQPQLVSLAKTYKIKTKIVCSFLKSNGEIGYQSYKVTGIYKTSNTAFDQLSAFVRIDNLTQVLGIGADQYHEINIILNNPDETLRPFDETLKEKFPKLSSMTWKQLAPDAGMSSDFMELYYYIIMGIIFFALAFGIINTMLMSILERIKELGMLMAIGMNKKRVFRMIMLETIFLTLTGAIVGMVIGWILIEITGKTGLNFSSVSEGFEAIGWAAKVYPTIQLSFFFGVSLMVIGISILSSIIPARKALKLKPVEAIRME